MRYFYNDPLAAAWMAKHFGMKFQFWFQNAIVKKGRLENITNDKFFLECEIGVSEFKFAYIHPESLHLLEPKDNDVLDCREWSNLGGGCGFQDYVEAFNEPKGKVILRNNIPFHWPCTE